MCQWEGLKGEPCDAPWTRLYFWPTVVKGVTGPRQAVYLCAEHFHIARYGAPAAAAT